MSGLELNKKNVGGFQESAGDRPKALYDGVPGEM
jgi:hypothetical protein